MDLDTARALKERLTSKLAPHFRSQRGAHSFAIGIATSTTDAEYGIAVRARVAEDLPSNARAVITNEARSDVDVRLTGPVRISAAHRLAITRGLAIGASIAHYRCTAGTLGFFARRIRDGVIGFVSNNHVIAAEDRGGPDDEILHPAPSDNGESPKDVVAYLDGDYPHVQRANPIVDCAFARLANGRQYDASSVEVGHRLTPSVASPDDQLEVGKIGRTTGLTFGRISAFELNQVVDFSFGSVRFQQQIEIESMDESPFSMGGDSGSLIFTREDSRPVGLLFAASAIGGAGDCGLTYANPIGEVLTALGVTFLA